MAECSTTSTSLNCESSMVYPEESEHIAYLNQTSGVQRERIKLFLINLDKSNRVDPESKRRNDVLQGVTEIVTDISQKIGEKTPFFSGKIIPMGSAHNNTKVGDSNEFDFVFELGVDTLSNGRATIKGVSNDGLIVKFDDKPDSPFFKPCHEFTSEESSTSSPDPSSPEYPENSMLLDVEAVKSNLSDVLKTVLSGLKLPDGWQHGGFNRPDFSGLREQGPSLLLQFDYLKTINQKPLCISVDFVPMIKLSLDKNAEFDHFLDLYSTRITDSQYCWYSLQDGCEQYGSAEEAMLQQYPFSSTAKVLLRICKVLHGLAGMYSPKYPFLDDVEKIVHVLKGKADRQGTTDPQDMPHLDVSDTAGFLRVYDSEEYLSYSDLGETVGDECMVKSYEIKRLVMALVAVDESSGKDWTEEDLPDLIMSIYMLLENTFRNASAYGMEEEEESDASLVEEEFTVPLEHLVDLTDPGDADEGNPTSSEASKLCTEDKCQEPRFFTAFAQVIKSTQISYQLELPILQSKISAIFQILRCVSDGKKSARIVAFKRAPKNGVDVRDRETRPVTKKEFRDMLQSD